MNFSSINFLEAFVMVIALSIDAFVASFAYGTSKIILPLSSIMVINATSSVILTLFLLLGQIISPYIPSNLASIVCFCLLFILGIVKLFDSWVKILIKKLQMDSKNVQFALSGITFVLTLYAEPELANIDNGNDLSPGEAFSLGMALSLDSAAVGFGAGVAPSNILFITILSFLIGTSVVYLGKYLGEKLAQKSPLNLSWLSGVLLLILAFMKL